MMEENKNSIFREGKLKKAAEPEQLDVYLKVTGFRAWFVVLAAALVLAAVFVWAFFGTIHPIIRGAGYCKDGTIECYFDQSRIQDLHVGDQVDIDGNAGSVKSIGSDVYIDHDVPSDVMFLLPESSSRWYSIAQISCSLEDGLYAVEYHNDAIHPISFLTQGNKN